MGFMEFLKIFTKMEIFLVCLLLLEFITTFSCLSMFMNFGKDDQITSTTMKEDYSTTESATVKSTIKTIKYTRGTKIRTNPIEIPENAMKLFKEQLENVLPQVQMFYRPIDLKYSMIMSLHLIDSDVSTICGAVALSKFAAITSYSCINRYDNIPVHRLILMAKEEGNGNDKPHRAMKYKVARILQHPTAGTLSIINDQAIIETVEPIDLPVNCFGRVINRPFYDKNVMIGDVVMTGMWIYTTIKNEKQYSFVVVAPGFISNNSTFVAELNKFTGKAAGLAMSKEERMNYHLISAPIFKGYMFVGFYTLFSKLSTITDYRWLYEDIKYVFDRVE